MGACGWGDWDRVLMNCDQFGQAFWPAHGTVDCSRMKKLIAIVEDEPAIRANYAAAFERNGYVVRAFANRRLAMQAFNSRLPDLAIIDISLEDEVEGGYELCRELRTLSPTLPIIFLTAKTDPRSMIDGINVGARFYVTKPFQLDDLLGKIQRALGGK